MKPLYPDAAKPHHIMFPREMQRHYPPRPDPMRRIDFHEPDAQPGDWAVFKACLIIIACGLIYYGMEFFK